MSNEGDAVRTEGMDELFTHLRKQDEEIQAIRADIAFLVEINRNLKGLAEFVKKWGGRLNRVAIWLAKIGLPLIALWQFCRDPIVEWLKRVFH